MSASPSTLYEWFANSVETFGDCSALEVGTERLTYAELGGLAERLATRLVATNGGAAPRRVGLLAERSVTAYAGYLAALRAGATVVPLNPQFPPARNSAMVAAASVDLAITETAPSGQALCVRFLDAGPETLAALVAEPLAELPPCPATPDDVAYIVFTSGSTGAPKAVPILHRNACAYLSQVVPRYEAGPDSRLSQAFDLTFDGSLHDLFVAWGNGGALVVPTRGQLLSPVTFIHARELTHWFSVPSLVSFADRLGTLTPNSMPSLRWSLFGGEPLTLTQARAWQEAAPASALANLYGPTEGTVACTEYRLPRRLADWPNTSNGTVPIGTPLPAAQVQLVDERETSGTVGELCIRGAQRTPGYLAPEDNAGRFVLFDRFGTAHHSTVDTPLTGQHWYRTGDRVAWQDGQLVHLGRLDHQVKVRGYRIELAEIEARLRDQPGVRDAIVVPVEVPDRESDLAAAVSGIGVDTARLQTALSEALPAYMIPRWISAFDELPLNANGKIDRRALAGALSAVAGR